MLLGTTTTMRLVAECTPVFVFMVVVGSIQDQQSHSAGKPLLAKPLFTIHALFYLYVILCARLPSLVSAKFYRLKLASANAKTRRRNVAEMLLW